MHGVVNLFALSIIVIFATLNDVEADDDCNPNYSPDGDPTKPVVALKEAVGVFEKLTEKRVRDSVKEITVKNTLENYFEKIN